MQFIIGFGLEPLQQKPSRSNRKILPRIEPRLMPLPTRCGEQLVQINHYAYCLGF